MERAYYTILITCVLVKINNSFKYHIILDEFVIFFCEKLLKIQERTEGNLARPTKNVALMSKNLMKVILKFHFTDFLYVIEDIVV